jgi:hypothetical protein
MLNRQILLHWIPFAFCSFMVYQYVHKGSNSLNNWQDVLIWLPMCFFYVGMVTHTMQNKIQKLQAEVQQLQQLG